MANRLEREWLGDFTGGVNLRADPFLLASNELDGVCNMEVDPRGGVYMRHGWQRWNTTDVTADPWDPRCMFVWKPASASSPTVLLVNDQKLLAATSGTFSVLEDNGTPITVSADDHGAAFAPWNDRLYVTCGRTRVSVKWTGTGDVTPLTAAGTGQWNNNYTTPANGVMPQAEHACTHGGYLFVADTREDGVNRPNRVRWSHPNNPEDWAENDFIDILDVPRVTGLVSFRDHLLIFAESKVYALYGYDSDSWQLTNVSTKVGARSPRSITASETHVYFYSHPDGVFSYDAQTLEEVSLQLRPIFTDGRFNSTELDQLSLGFLNRRLWFCAPYSEVGGFTTVFVYDPSVGAWTAFVGADNEAVGPFAEDSLSAVPRFFAVSRTTPAVMMVDREGTYLDEHEGVNDGAPFQSWFVTRWVSGPTPDGKKSWKRPTIVVRELPDPYILQYSVFHNYDSGDVRRTKNVPVGSSGEVGAWGDPGLEWGAEGLTWGESTVGAGLEKGSGLGAAAAVQLRVAQTTPGAPWAISGINFKFVSRRYR